MPIKIELFGSALKISLIKFKVSLVPPSLECLGIPPYIPHFSMSLEGGQFSRSNFWKILVKKYLFFVGVITKMKILAFFHQKFKFLCLKYDNITF